MVLKSIENMFNPNKPKATVQNGTLVLSLPNAKNPVVWRLNMGQVETAAIEVREDRAKGFKLVLKNTETDVQDIAPFDSKDEALKALRAVMSAVENVSHQSFAGEQDNASRKSSSGQKQSGGWGVLIFGLVLIMIVMYGFFALSPQPTVNSGGGALPSSATNFNTGASSSSSTGKPLSAEDFLRSR